MDLCLSTSSVALRILLFPPVSSRFCWSICSELCYPVVKVSDHGISSSRYNLYASWRLFGRGMTSSRPIHSIECRKDHNLKSLHQRLFNSNSETEATSSVSIVTTSEDQDDQEESTQPAVNIVKKLSSILQHQEVSNPVADQFDTFHCYKRKNRCYHPTASLFAHNTADFCGGRRYEPTTNQPY